MSTNPPPFALSKIYRASPTLSKFHQDNNFVRALIGPVGSGKSVACVCELLRRSYDQQPDEFGIRATKWAVIRNTYRELNDTTLATFFNWIPEELGHFDKQSMTFTLRFALEDGTSLFTQFLFRALDRPKDIKKLLSLDLTGGWINECREIPKAIVDMLQTRCGRYPQTILDEEDPNYWDDPDNCAVLYGPTWHGIIMDTNPPDSDSWFYKSFEVDRPETWSIYHQPAGDGPRAENKRHLVRGYYENMSAGKTKEWIKVYVKGQYGFVSDGKPIYPEYNDDVHYTDEVYQVDKRLTVFVGIDFGLTPAAVIGQRTPAGAIVIFDELVTFDMGAFNFGALLKEKLSSRKYQGCEFEIYGDPAGVGRAQTDERTPFMILSKHGIEAFPTHTNDPTIRREVVVDFLTRLDMTAQPALRITYGAPEFRKAMNGGYCYKRLQVSNEERFQDVPNKNKFSHVAEAGQYLFLGACGDAAVIGGFDKKPLDYSRVNKKVV
jgi:hypothetical protein